MIIYYYPTYKSENFDPIKRLSIEKYPIVIIDKSIHDIEIDTVLCENYKPSFALTKHLVNCGHRSIAFMCESYIDERSSLREWFLGYCDALTDAGIPLNTSLILYPNGGHQAGVYKNEMIAFFKDIADTLQRDRSTTAVQVASAAAAV